MSSEDAHTPIVANAARLLADSKLLLNHSRYASATALAVLALEELGKVILNLWGDPPYGARRHKRMSDHLRKQRAVASLL
ncbi:MAG: AbiV family abortive infection protein, partial [Acetobacteraceae bacterium]